MASTSSKTDFASKYAFAFESSSDDDDVGGLGVTKAEALAQPVMLAEKKEEAPDRREAAGETAGLKTYFEDEGDEDKGLQGQSVEVIATNKMNTSPIQFHMEEPAPLFNQEPTIQDVKIATTQVIQIMQWGDDTT